MKILDFVAAQKIREYRKEITEEVTGLTESFRDLAKIIEDQTDLNVGNGLIATAVNQIADLPEWAMSYLVCDIECKEGLICMELSSNLFPEHKDSFLKVSNHMTKILTPDVSSNIEFSYLLSEYLDDTFEYIGKTYCYGDVPWSYFMIVCSIWKWLQQYEGLYGVYRQDNLFWFQFRQNTVEVGLPDWKNCGFVELTLDLDVMKANSRALLADSVKG